MKLTLNKTRIQQLIAQRNGYLMLALLSLIMNMILIIALISAFKTERIVLVPPDIERPMWVTSNKVSSEYLSGMSLYLTNLLLNVNASNASLQHQLFLKLVDGRNYQSIKTNLIQEEEKLKKEHMSIHFQVNAIKADASHLLTNISGVAEYRIGETFLPAKHLTYAIQFSYQGGLLKLTSFEEIKNEK